MKHGALQKEELDVILNPYEMIHPEIADASIAENIRLQVFESTLGFVKKNKIKISCKLGDYAANQTIYEFILFYNFTPCEVAA